MPLASIKWRLLHADWHVSKFIKNLKEIIVVNNIIKASCEEIHKLNELTRLDASHILKDHIDKVFFLYNSSVIWIKLSVL
jgi:hypothetical protein